jgi:mono/diheme cytochrome c family protein
VNDVHVRVLCVVLLAFVLAGCGGRPLGKRVFASRCAGCHTLTGRDTPVDGGDLALGKLGVADIESFARIMPVRQRMTRAELRAVANYVVDRREALARK